MAEQPQSGWLRRFAAHNAKVIYTAALASLVASVASILATVAIYRGAKHEGVELPAGAPSPVVVVMQDAPPAVDYTPTTGWVPDAGVIADNLNPAWTAQFDATPAGMAALGDEDVFLWQAVRKVTGKPLPWYPNVNQESVGCCVGCGWKHCADVCQAFQILSQGAHGRAGGEVQAIGEGGRAGLVDQARQAVLQAIALVAVAGEPAALEASARGRRPLRRRTASPRWSKSTAWTSGRSPRPAPANGAGAGFPPQSTTWPACIRSRAPRW